MLAVNLEFLFGRITKTLKVVGCPQYTHLLIFLSLLVALYLIFMVHLLH